MTTIRMQISRICTKIDDLSNRNFLLSSRKALRIEKWFSTESGELRQVDFIFLAPALPTNFSPHSLRKSQFKSLLDGNKQPSSVILMNRERIG
jgi:hypothetical protein